MARNTLAPGGYIGGEPPRRPYFNQLSGVWKLEDAVERQKAGTWANPLGIEDLFSTYLYTGNGSTQTITNGIDLAGKGGLVWIKGRSLAYDHYLQDTLRGPSKVLATNVTDPEVTYSTGVSTFNSNGWTMGSQGGINANSQTYASWTFRKQAKFFDVVTYTGNGSNRTIAHNLGSVPGCIIVKRTDTADDWVVYHRSLTSASYVLLLNTTNAQINAGAGPFNSTAPTSSVFSLGPDFNTNASGGTYVAYLFAHDAGGFGDSGNESVISCGSYTGNGSATGPTVTLGWEPQWLLIKQTTAGSATNWVLLDSMRGLPVGSNSARLNPNTNSAESTTTSDVDLLPTGFQLKTTNGAVNASSGTYIYIAIRRGPMKTPTDATKVFDDIAYTGNGSTRTQYVGWPIDLSINMARPGIGDSPTWNDRLRGTGVDLYSNDTSSESANGSAGVQFDNQTNLIVPSYRITNGTNYIDWVFRRAPGFFDVVAYTGTGSARTVAHSLGVAPELMIVRRRNSAANWIVYSANAGLDFYGTLNSSEQFYSGNSVLWNSTTPASSVFSLGSSAAVNASGGTYIAYLFATCPGVSKVGSYTGTGTTLSVDCGFTNGARFVLIKRTNSSGDWFVWDTARGIIAANDPYLLLNSNAAENTSTDYIDPLNSGFQISSTAPAAINANGGSFIFLAIA